jgi:hypothetical protein
MLVDSGRKSDRFHAETAVVGVEGRLVREGFVVRLDTNLFAMQVAIRSTLGGVHGSKGSMSSGAFHAGLV